VAQRPGILSRVRDFFRSASTSASHRSTAASPTSRATVPGTSQQRAGEPGRTGGSSTVEVDPPAPDALRIGYAPSFDGDPDAGEIVWTWVPYAENDGRGKDRPVLVVARESGDRVYAVRLTSKPQDGDRDFLAIGSGPWDSRGRPSWVDVDQLYSVHVDGMRREASALDLDRFVRVADALHRRYGWAAGD
jgi:hypothetical protein